MAGEGVVDVAHVCGDWPGERTEGDPSPVLLLTSHLLLSRIV
jgi:hypothetical protein